MGLEFQTNSTRVNGYVYEKNILDVDHSDLDNSVFVSFPEICFVLIMYCTLSNMLGHVTSSTNDQLYTIKINKDFLMRLLKRGDLVSLLISPKNHVNNI